MVYVNRNMLEQSLSCGIPVVCHNEVRLVVTKQHVSAYARGHLQVYKMLAIGDSYIMRDYVGRC
jgi:hypothetical protein